MATYDVRTEEDKEYDSIIFYTHGDTEFDTPVAFKIKPMESSSASVKIFDSIDEYVIIESKEHAQNLIKALNKAIEFGWIK